MAKTTGKYTDDIREKARALLTVNSNVEEVARTLGIPRTTLISWRDKWLEETGEDSLTALREEKRQEFINEAWEVIRASMDIISEGLSNLDTSMLTASDINALANTTSKLYQMQALATGDATERVESHVSLIKFEDIPT